MVRDRRGSPFHSEQLVLRGGASSAAMSPSSRRWHGDNGTSRETHEGKGEREEQGPRAQRGQGLPWCRARSGFASRAEGERPLPRATVPGQALRHPCGEQGCGAEGSAADPGDGVRAPDAAMRKLPEDVHSATFVSGLGEQVPSECGRGRFGVALRHGHAPPPPGAVAKVGGGSVCRLHAVRAGRSDGECRVPGLPPHGDDSREPAAGSQ